MDVLLYTWTACSHCQTAKELLDERRIDWREHVLDGDQALKRRLAALFGKATMPYVLVDGEPLGGLEELKAWIG